MGNEAPVLLALSVLPATREDPASHKVADVALHADAAASSPHAGFATKLTNTFRCLDVTETGKISRQDLKLLLSQLDKRISSANVDQLLTAFTDQQEDGDVDYAQF